VHTRATTLSARSTKPSVYNITGKRQKMSIANDTKCRLRCNVSTLGRGYRKKLRVPVQNGKERVGGGEAWRKIKTSRSGREMNGCVR
jgi:hypothetical protein